MNTARLHQLVDRFREGDREAANDLIRAALGRMQALARDALQRSRIARRWADSDDVLQNALLRLQGALREVRPESTRAFFGFAAEMIRRELIDLVRRFSGPEGLAANLESNAHRFDSAGGARPDLEPLAPVEPPDHLEQWEAFHRAVEHLDSEMSEVFRLRYYHEMGNEQIADLLDINVRTVRRRYRKACERLAPHLEQWLREKE